MRNDAAGRAQDGRQHKVHYVIELARLQQEIKKFVPAIDEEQGDLFMQAYAAVGAARGDAWRDVKEFAATLEPVKNAQAKALELALPILEDLDPFLSNDAHDALLVKAAVIADATPEALAEFAQKDENNKELLDALLSDPDLMKRMLVAGGARCARYGEAMKIYTDILKTSEGARRPGILQRFALGLSLELAVPIALRDRTSMEGREASTIDPVERYLHYEKAYRAGALDPAFPTLTAWDCRFIPGCQAPNEELAWGREMLRTYRPDHVLTPDYKWRYVEIVKTDVKYGGKNPSRPELGFFQDILNMGGVCGRRAFVGRFILQAHGIPTFGMRQRGHAAVGHWTPDGWTTNFGAHWRWNWWDRPGHSRSGLDFLLETQARRYPSEFIKVLRAEWVGDALGEQKRDRRKLGSGGPWNALALYEKRAIVAEGRPVEVALAGEELAEANESTRAEKILEAEITDADRKIFISADGIIHIPAAACSSPINSTEKIRFMKSFDGGMQLHYNRLGKPEAFEYTVDAPSARRYALVARVATINTDQQLSLFVNQAETATEIALPYTVGLWQETKPVQITLGKGRNTLTFTRDDPNYGASIKVFMLTPVR